MSDETMSFMPWTNDFSTGLYLVGIEVYEDAIVPKGWTKWILPARKYLVVEVNHDNNEGTFRTFISSLLPDLGLKLTGAVCDFIDPVTGQNKLLFPVN